MEIRVKLLSFHKLNVNRIPAYFYIIYSKDGFTEHIIPDTRFIVTSKILLSFHSIIVRLK